MKIAIFTDTFWPQVNGAALAVADFATELGRRGHKTVIFCPKTSIKRGKRYKAKNVRIHTIGSVSAEAIYPEWRLALGGIFKIYRILKKFKPDIIHFHTPLSLATDAFWIAKILKKPLVGTCHMDLSGIEHLRWIKPIVKGEAIFEVISSIVGDYLTSVFQKADLIVVPSEATRRSLLKSGWKKIKITVVPNGVAERPRILNGSEKEKMRHKYNLKEKVIIYIGRLSADKNLEILLKAMKMVVKKDKNVSLFLVGDGPDKKHLEKRAEKIGIKDNVIFSGYLPHEEIISGGTLSLGDVFVNPSKMETQCLALVEAMAAGIPVIGARAAALPDLIKDNGFLVEKDKPGPLAEKALLLLQDKSLREKMGKKSKQIFEEKYTIEKTTDRLEKVYQEVLKTYPS